MSGDDIRDFQVLLNHRFKAWKIGRQVGVDGSYGKDTREAAMQVCVGLGIIAATAMAHGVMPELRTKLRNPAKRSDDEKQLSKTRGHQALPRTAAQAVRDRRRRRRRRRAVRGRERPGLDRPAPALGAPARLDRRRDERLPLV